MSLFYFNKDNITMFVLVYVDDIFIAISDQKAIEGLLRQLNSEFALKDLGSLHYFLDIEVKKVSDGIILSREKYASDMLQHTRMGNCKPVSSPMSTSEKLLVHEGISLGLNDATNY
jgi:hypothetical protein